MAGYRLPLEFAEELVKTVAADRGKRRISSLCRSVYWQKAAEPCRCRRQSWSQVSISLGRRSETDSPGGVIWGL